MESGDPSVFVVDDDASMREALERLFDSAGYAVRCFPSAAAFAESGCSTSPGCLVLDVRMPGQSGLEFQRELRSREIAIPIVFLSGHADVPMSVRAMKDGAIEFLTKPFREQELLEAVDRGLKIDADRRAIDSRRAALEARLATLSAGEREVMLRVVAGQANKVIADDLRLSEITVKVRRGNVMRKMGAGSLPDLVRIAMELKFC